MAKRESTFINMFLTLLVVTVISSLGASAVYNLTKEPIEEVAKQKQQQAIERVMPGFSEIKRFSVMPKTGPDSLVFFEGWNDTINLGVAVKTYTYQGYSGLITLMVGFKPDGSIINYEVLVHKETPGLGSKISDQFFKDRFIGKDPATYQLKVVKDGGNVDAITAATISSRAMCDAMQRAYDAYRETKQQPKE